MKKKSKYIPVYTKKQMESDESKFEKAVQSGNPSNLDYSSFKRLFLNDICNNSKLLSDHCLFGIDIKDIGFALQDPKHRWEMILDISTKLMYISPHYYRLNMLFSNMAMFCYGIDVVDVKATARMDTLKKSYSALASKLDAMNLKHEFSKIMKYIPYQDIYCGLVYEGENESDFFIQHLDFRLVRLYEVQDGLYNFAINLAKIQPNKLLSYPDYVRQAYLDFQKDKGGSWYCPPEDKQICIKLNSQWTYPFPFLVGLVRDILDLDLYKKLKLQSATTDNYKAIMMKVPIDENNVDKPLLTPKTLSIFADINKQSIGDDIGLLYTLGSDGNAISFKNSSNTRNNVSDAVDEIYNSSGVTKELYNGSSSGTAVTFSIENDSGFIYSLYRQFERWVNRFIKSKNYNKAAYKFVFYLIDITTLNKDTVSKRYKEACTLGAPVIDRWLSTIDMTPAKILGSYIVQNEIFDFHNKLIPLSSSYNGGTSGDVGRPTNESKGETLDVSGEITADADSNIDR